MANQKNREGPGCETTSSKKKRTGGGTQRKTPGMGQAPPDPEVTRPWEKKTVPRELEKDRKQGGEDNGAGRRKTIPKRLRSVGKVQGEKKSRDKLKLQTKRSGKRKVGEKKCDGRVVQTPQK